MTSQPAITVSCEFYPPRTEKGVDTLRRVREELNVLNPEYYSVTFGAGGSTQAQTFDTVTEIQQQSGVDAAPHLSCIASTADNIRQLLHDYKDKGVKRIVALRGDKPSGWVGRLGEFAYANELVKFIREETGDHFTIEVAAYPEVHPQAKSAETDLKFFKQKVDAGASAAITQYFYNADAYAYFLDDCRKLGIEIPIVPGIMPIYNYEQLVRFSDTCGAEVPRWLKQRLQGLAEDKEGLKEFGLDVVTSLCERLIQEGAPSLHFYTLNRSDFTLEIVKRLNTSS